MAHGKEGCRALCLASRQREAHGNVPVLCRAQFLCRAAFIGFAVLASLPWAFEGLCRATGRCRAALVSLPCTVTLPCATL